MIFISHRVPVHPFGFTFRRHFLCVSHSWTVIFVGYLVCTQQIYLPEDTFCDFDIGGLFLLLAMSSAPYGISFLKSHFVTDISLISSDLLIFCVICFHMNWPIKWRCQILICVVCVLSGAPSRVYFMKLDIVTFMSPTVVVWRDSSASRRISFLVAHFMTLISLWHRQTALYCCCVVYFQEKWLNLWLPYSRTLVFVCCSVCAQQNFLLEGTFCDFDITELFCLLPILSAPCRVYSLSWIRRTEVFVCSIVCTQQNWCPEDRFYQINAFEIDSSGLWCLFSMYSCNSEICFPRYI